MSKNIPFDISQYVSVDTLQDYKSFLKTFYKSERKLIGEFNIPENEYDFVSIKSGEYSLVTRSNTKATLFFKKKYFNDVLLKYFSSQEEQLIETPKCIPNTSIDVPLVDDKTRIYLRKNERIKVNGKFYDLILRGERTYDKLFISVHSVGKMVGVERLDKILKEKKILDEDYVLLNIVFEIKGVKKKIKQCYFTYFQFIKYLYVSRSIVADELVTQFTKILFTHQFGTLSQKKKLASKLLGVSVDEVKNVLKHDMNKLSCVYFLVLGLVKELRTTMSIDNTYSDEMYVCKFGRTKDLKTRIAKHDTDFSKYGCTVSLKYYSRIDSSACSKAETAIKNYINTMKINFTFDKFKELVIVSKNDLNTSIRDQFFSIERTFCIENKEQAEQLRKLEDEMKIKDLQNENKVQQLFHDHEIEKMKIKDLQNENKIQKLSHAHEIEKMKMEMKIQSLEYEIKLQQLKTPK